MLRFPDRRARWLTARYWFFNTLIRTGPRVQQNSIIDADLVS
jgi:hypothetical protein